MVKEFIFIFLEINQFVMGRLLLIPVFVLLLQNAYAQEDQLLHLYSQEQIENLKAENPEVLEYWKVYLNQGWVIDEAKPDVEISSSVPVDDIAEFNPLAHQLYPTEGTQYIGIVNSSKVIIIYPKSHIIYRFNQSRK